MNSVILKGRIVNDIELKTTQNGIELVSFRVAVKRKFKDKDGNYQSDFINVIAFKGTAKFLNSYGEKGRMILLQGSLQSKQYEDSQGKKITAYEVIANEIDILDRKNDNLGRFEIDDDFKEPTPEAKQWYKDLKDNHNNSTPPPDVYTDTNELEYDPFTEK